MAKESAAVQVALRIRPLTTRDRAQPRFANLSNDDVLKLHEKTVHVVPHNKLFTFDHVFGSDSQQSQVFEALGAKLIHKFVDGYNVTILAYGQTSSGKTYTMGTAQHQSGRYEEEGIVPRAMALLFDALNGTASASASPSHTGGGDRPVTPAPSVSSSTDNTASTRLRPPSRISHHASSSNIHTSNSNGNGNSNGSSSKKYAVKVSFIEIYNEELNDLLNGAPVSERPPITIREDAKGHIYWTGVKEVPVNSMEDVLYYLEQGTRNRATGATDMNEKSSRSHAIFSVSLRNEKWVARGNDKRSRDGEWMVSNSKFHFVDLAGSERLKRTAAEGDRRKEGININAGLLALGNVISALGDPAKRNTHVPYRDSKLTRLLQDSLGGSATTLMIACVSPAEYNLSETLNTLQYANRARNIKNRVERNEVEEWMTTDNLELLRSIIARLKSEVRHLKAGVAATTGIVGSEGSVASASAAAAAAGASADVDQLFQEQRLMIADLQRQVEELDGEASVTRERNRMVEAELKRLRAIRKREEELSKKSNSDFQHLVEPVIEEYEKSISALESQLAMARAALNHSDIGFEEQRAKLEQCELMLETQDQTVVDLRTRISKLQEREQSNETYIDELEGKLMQSAKDACRDQELLNELKTRIMRFKETDENTEQYIFDLEKRLATSEADKAALEKTVGDLEGRIADRDDTIAKLRIQLAKAEDTDTQKLMLNELDGLTAKCNELEKERDRLKTEVERLASAAAAQHHQQSRTAVDPAADGGAASLSASSSGKQQSDDDDDDGARMNSSDSSKTRRQAFRRSFAEEKETSESAAAAVEAAKATARAEQEAARATQLARDLRELQGDHQETVKELDEVLLRYQEALEQVEMLQRTGGGQEHPDDALSKEMSRAKEDADMREREAHMHQVRDLEARLKTLEAQQQELTQQLEHAQTDKAHMAESYQMQLHELQAKHTKADDEMHALRAALDDSKSALTQQTALLEEQLMASRSELDEYKAKLGAGASALQEAQAELARHKELLGSKENEIAAALLARSSSDDAGALLRQQLASAEAELQRHKGLLSDREIERHKVAELQQQLSAMQNTNSSSSSSSSSHLTSLQQQLAAAQSELVHRQHLLETSDKAAAQQNDQLQKRLADTLRELEQHKRSGSSHASLVEVEALKQRLAGTLSELEQHKAVSGAELDALQKRLAESLQQLDQQQHSSQRLEALQEQLAAAHAELAQHTANKAAAHEQLDRMRGRLAETVRELERQRQQSEHSGGGLDQALQQQLADARTELAQRHEDAHLTHAQLEHMQQRVADTLAELARHKTDAGSQLHALQQHLLDTQAELERSKRALESQACQRLDEMQQRLQDAHAELLQYKLSSQQAAADEDREAQQLASLQQQLAETQAELARQLASQHEAAQEQLAAKQAELERHQAHASQDQRALQQQLADARAELARYQSTGEQEMAALRQQLAERDNQVERHKAMAAAKERELAEQRSDQIAEQLKVRSVHDGQQLAAKDKAIAALEEELGRAVSAQTMQQQDIRDLEEALEELEAQRHEAEQEKLRLLDEVASENDTLAAQIEELKEQRDADARRVAALEAALQNAEQEQAAARTRIQGELQAAAADEVTQLTQALAAKDTALEQLQGELHAAKEQLQAVSSWAISEQQHRALRQQLDDAHSANKEKDEHLRSLRSQVEAHARTIGELRDQLEKATFTSHVAAADRADDKARLYEDRIAQLDASRSQLEDDNAEFQTLADELEAEVSRLLQNEHDAQNTIAQHAAKCTALEQRIKRTEHALSAAQQAAADQRDQMDKATADLREQLEKAAAEHREERRRIQAESTKLQTDLAAERKAKDDAQQALAALERQLEELISKKSKFMCF